MSRPSRPRLEAIGEQIIELLRAAAHDHGSTILVVGHDARIIPHVDRVVHMEDGVLSEHVPNRESGYIHREETPRLLGFSPDECA